jgi:hypothetical protein
MSKGDIERRKFFDKYTANLTQLLDWKIIAGIETPFDPTYVCPVCLRKFGPEALDQTIKNPLTLEDVPPKALGGKANILTCKECNNTAGQKIDSNLQKNLTELDNRQFKPGTSFAAKIGQENESFQGQVNVDDKGGITIRHNDGHNKKEDLAKFMGKISPKTGNPILNIQFNSPKIDFKRMQVALLKTAYLSVFEKYGYTFILDPMYNPVREQILNPDKDIYPVQFWFIGPFKHEHIGVHFLRNKGLESVISVFALKSASIRIFGALLPIKNNPIIEVVAGFHAALALGLPHEAEIKRMNAEGGYLFNKQNLENLFQLIKGLRKN